MLTREMNPLKGFVHEPHRTKDIARSKMRESSERERIADPVVQVTSNEVVDPARHVLFEHLGSRLDRVGLVEPIECIVAAHVRAERG